MTEIDRRTLIGIGGASLVLAGCKGSKDYAENSKLRGPAGADRTWGLCEIHGKSAGLPTHPKKNFVPQFLCAVYIKFDGAVRPIIRHAYTRWNSSSNLKSMAQTLLEQLRKDQYSSDVIRHEVDFNNFTFKTQQYIVFFVDNLPTEIGFARHPQDLLYKHHIVRFTPFSGNYPYLPREKNHAFFGFDELKIDKGNFNTDLAYQMKFYNTNDLDGNDITADESSNSWRIYSMNIHLHVPQGSGNYLPIVLDPDTGNMGSDP